MEPDNSRGYFEWKRKERLAGRMNPFVKGARGLAKLVEQLNGRVTHSLFCKCSECITPEVRAWMDSLPHLFGGKQSGELPFPEVESPKKPKQRTDGPCSTCDSTGRIRNWSGKMLDCCA